MGILCEVVSVMHDYKYYPVLFTCLALIYMISVWPWIFAVYMRLHFLYIHLPCIKMLLCSDIMQSFANWKSATEM